MCPSCEIEAGMLTVGEAQREGGSCPRTGKSRPYAETAQTGGTWSGCPAMPSSHPLCAGLGAGGSYSAPRSRK